MKIEAEIKNLKNILANDEKFYQIPDYQRPYAWDKDNISDLIHDLVEAYLENEDDKTYFCGSLVLVNNPSHGRYDIIDGQQRITTFTVLACVLRELYLESLSPKAKKYIINSIQDEFEENKRKLRFLTNITNQNHFEQTVIKGINFVESKNYERDFTNNNYLKNAHYLKYFLAELVGEHNLNIDDFTVWLYEYVVLTVITCPSQDTAIQIFNVLNDRGMPLSAIDILKASLLNKLKDSDEDRKSFLAQWDKIISMLDQFDLDIDGLLTVFLYYKLGSNPKNRLDKELIAIFQKEGKDSLTIINDIYNFGIAFIDTLNEENKYIYCLRYLKHKIYWNSILVTAKYTNYEYIDELKRVLVAYYYQNWIAGATIARIKQTSFNIIRHVKSSSGIEAIKSEIRNNLNKYSTTETYKDELFSSYVYGKNWDKSVLLALEYFSQDDSVMSFIPLSNKIHVEHILPQTSTKYWKDIFSDEAMEEWKNSISNLTLLSMRKNIQAQNYTFEEKKEIYKSKDFVTSSFKITQDVLSENSWDENVLKKRKEKIIMQTVQLFDI